jgi:hypothetical protein
LFVVYRRDLLRLRQLLMRPKRPIIYLYRGEAGLTPSKMTRLLGVSRVASGKRSVRLHNERVSADGDPDRLELLERQGVETGCVIRIFKDRTLESSVS